MADKDVILRFEGVGGFEVSPVTARGGAPTAVMHLGALQAAGLTPIGEPIGFQLEPPRRSRGGEWTGRTGQVVLDVPRSDDDHGELLVVRNDNGYRIVQRHHHLSDDERSRFTVPVAPALVQPAASSA